MGKAPQIVDFHSYLCHFAGILRRFAGIKESFEEGVIKKGSCLVHNKSNVSKLDQTVESKKQESRKGGFHIW